MPQPHSRTDHCQIVFSGSRLPSCRTGWILALATVLGACGGLSASPRAVRVDVDLGHSLGALNIGKVASLGQGGLSPDPIWAGRAPEIRALHPRVIRLFLQEYFNVLPARGTYDFSTMDKTVDLVRQSGAEPMMNVCFKPSDLFDRFMTPGGSAAMAKWWNRNHQNSGLLDYENNIRPAYFAFKLLSRLTGDRRKVSSSDELVHGLAAFDARPGIYDLMIWNFSDRPAQARLRFTGLSGVWKAEPITLDSLTPNPEENSRLHALDPVKLDAERAAPAIDLEPWGICFWMIER